MYPNHHYDNAVSHAKGARNRKNSNSRRTLDSDWATIDDPKLPKPRASNTQGTVSIKNATTDLIQKFGIWIYNITKNHDDCIVATLEGKKVWLLGRCYDLRTGIETSKEIITEHKLPSSSPTNPSSIIPSMIKESIPTFTNSFESLSLTKSSTFVSTQLERVKRKLHHSATVPISIPESQPTEFTLDSFEGSPVDRAVQENTAPSSFDPDSSMVHSFIDDIEKDASDVAIDSSRDDFVSESSSLSHPEDRFMLENSSKVAAPEAFGTSPQTQDEYEVISKRRSSIGPSLMSLGSLPEQYISNSPKTGDGFELVSQSPLRPHNRPVEFPSATPPSESAMESTVLIETMPSTDTAAGAMLYTVEKDDKDGENVEVVNSWPLTPGFFESTQPSKASNIHAKINETHTIQPQIPKIDISLRVEALMKDWESRFWFTYTVGFERIKRSIFSSDVGWGCMHRSGQCILSFAFTCVLLGRDWRLNGKHDKDQEAAYQTILSWFHDSSNSFYSIQRIARMGEKLGVKVGQWFSPGTLAHVLRRLSLLHPSCPLRIYVPPVAVLSIPTMLALSEVTITPSNPTSNGAVPTATFWTPLVIFIPVRLGLSDISADFWDNIKTLFTWECCLGIVGGRPKKSFWFVGWEGDNLLYFDPHVSRDFDSSNSGIPVHKYHTTQIRSTPLSSIDPSMLLGFLIKSKTELENFLYKVQHELNQNYPLFSVVEHVTEWDDDDLEAEDGEGDRKDGGVFMDMMEMEGDSLRSQYSRVEMTDKRKQGKSRKRDDSFEVL